MGFYEKNGNSLGFTKEGSLLCQVASCKNLKIFTETTKRVVIVIYACASNPEHKVSYI